MVDALGLVDALFVLCRFAGVVADICEEVSNRFFALDLKKIQLYNIQIQVQSTACAEWSLIFERKYTVGCHTRVEALQS